MATLLTAAASVVAGLVGGGGKEGEPTVSSPRPVVLVPIDTLRADSLPFTPDRSPSTPFLESLAPHGIVYDRAFGRDWRTAWKTSRTFLWIHYFDPHVPYRARMPWIEQEAPDFRIARSRYPAEWDFMRLAQNFPRDPKEAGERIAPLYRSEISYVDEPLRLKNEEIGFMDDDVLFVLTSDHGEEFVEHGRFGHSLSLFEETIHVPLFLRWPARIEGGSRLEAQVSILDVYPTLAQLLQLPVPAEIRGGILPGVTGGEDRSAQPMFFHTYNMEPPIDAVREGKWKLIRPQGEVSQLYDLESDPGETTDVAARHPDFLTRLEVLLEQHVAALPPPPGDSGVAPISDEDEAKLRHIGYGGEQD